MGNYAVRRIDEMEAIFHGSFKRAGAELGVESFGLQIFDMPPGNDQYPEHDHSEDGQEEVYVTLRGSGDWDIEGERVHVDPEMVVRISVITSCRSSTQSEMRRCTSLDRARGIAPCSVNPTANKR